MKAMKIAFFLCLPLWAATYYVSPTGNDGNPGTQTLPLQTLQRGHDLASTGDTVIAMDGTYTAQTGSQCCGFMVNITKPGLTFKAQNRHAAIVDVNLKLYSAFYCGATASNTTIQGFVIRNGYWSGIAANSGGCKGLMVTDNEIGPICTRFETSQTGCTGIFTDGAATGMVTGNYIHNIGRTNDAGNTFDHGIYSLGNLTVTNNMISPYNGWAIQTAGGFSGSIVGNTFNGAVQFESKPGQIMLWGPNGAVTIANNTSNNAAGTFLTQYAWTSPNCLVYGNTVNGGASLGLPADCSTTSPAPSVTVTVNGQPVKTTLPITIGIQQ